MRIALILLALLFVVGSFFVGRASNVKKSKVSEYKNDSTLFCSFDEIEKFEVCKEARTHEDLKSGGSITQYRCNANFGYIEVNNLTEESRAKFNFFVVKLVMNGYKINKICKMDGKEVYEAKR